jgi:hypothetical protein
MRIIKIGILLLPTMLLMGFSLSQGQTRFGVSFSHGRLRSFDFATSNYYHFPPRDVVWVREHGIPENEIPVVFYIARYSGWEPMTIVRMRLNGLSWGDISLRCGIGPGIYGLPFRVMAGTLHGTSYVNWRSENDRMRGYNYTDRDIIGGVHREFAMGHHKRDWYTVNTRPHMRDSNRNTERHDRW